MSLMQLIVELSDSFSIIDSKGAHYDNMIT